MNVTLVIPTMNEAGAIGRVLKEIPKKKVNEIIVIDGHSTDNTAREARAELRRRKDKFILQKKKGFGNALLEAFEKASGDVVVIMDGDGSQNPKDIPLFLKKIKEGYTYVMGSRYGRGGRSDDDTIIRLIGNRALTSLTNLVHHTKVSDSLYLFIAVKRRDLEKLKLSSPGIEICVEIPIKAHRAGLKFAEIPVIERARYAGESKVNAFWSGLSILKMILRKY